MAVDPQDPLARAYFAGLAEVRSLRERLAELRGEPRAPHADDPDVSRIVESLAWLSAGTRLAAEEGTRARWRRLCAGHLDFLQEPLPAMGLLRARPGPGRVEPVRPLPKGTEVQLTAPDGARGSFRTCRALTILPIQLQEVRVEPRDGGRRLVFLLVSRAPLPAGPDELCFKIEVQQGLLASLQLQWELREHLVEAHAFFDAPCGRTGPASCCEVSYRPAADDTSLHPVVAVRRWFHFPEEDLVLRVVLPIRTVPWRTLTIAFDLDDGFPFDGAPGAENFSLFTVPIENLQRDTAESVQCDGTRTSFPVVSSQRGRVLHSVLSVTALTDSGPRPLRSAHVPGTGPSWELDRVPGERLPRLLVDHPTAFFRAETVVLEGLWHQPEFGHTGVAAAALYAREVAGVSWSLAGKLRPARPSTVGDDPDHLLRVLRLRMYTTLDIDQLRLLLDALGAIRPGPFADLPGRLRSLERGDARRRSDGTSVRVWRLALDGWESRDAPRVHLFLERVRDLLDAWLPEQVQLEVSAAGLTPAQVFEP